MSYCLEEIIAIRVGAIRVIIVSAAAFLGLDR
jgi:hypothetical protein